MTPVKVRALIHTGAIRVASDKQGEQRHGDGKGQDRADDPQPGRQSGGQNQGQQAGEFHPGVEPLEQAGLACGGVGIHGARDGGMQAFNGVFDEIAARALVRVEAAHRRSTMPTPKLPSNTRPTPNMAESRYPNAALRT